MIYYSTGKSPYLKGRGLPIEVNDILAPILLKKGSIVKSIDELDDGEQKQVVIETEEPKQVELFDVMPEVKPDEPVKRTYVKRATKKKKTVKAKTKKSKTEKAG